MKASQKAGLSNPHKEIAAGWGLKLNELGDACEKLSATETRQRTGADTPSIGWVYHDIRGRPTGVVRYRHYDPKRALDRFGKPRKYSGKRGDPVSLYIPPVFSWRPIAKDTSQTIYITEGEAKAYLSALRFEWPVLGIQGCDAWQANGVPAAEFGDFTWKGRRVELIPDTDWANHRKPNIRRGFAKLGKFLATQGADVHIRFLDHLSAGIAADGDPRDAKTGLDDWLNAVSDGSHSKADCAQVQRAFDALTTKPLTDPFVQTWDGDSVADLPAALRNLKALDPTWLDEKPPEPEYIVQPYLQMGESGLSIGEAGIGKTTFNLELFVAVCTGTKFFEYPVHKKRRAMYVMLERHANSFRRRLHKVAHAMIKHLKLPDGHRARFLEDLKANAVPIPLAGDSLNLIEFKNNQWVFLDPLSRLHGGNENDSAVASAVTKALERIVQQVGCSIVLVHHTGKNTQGGQYSGRGSSAFNDNTSEAIVLTGLDRKELEKLNLDSIRDDEKDCAIVLVHHARCSDGRPADDMYLVRRRNGLLRRVFLHTKTPDQMLDGHMPAIQQWAGDSLFTKNDFVTARQEFDLAKHRAEKLFDAAAGNGAFVKAGKKRKRGDLYRLAKLPSLPGNLRATGQLEKRRPGNLKNGGAANA